MNLSFIEKIFWVTLFLICATGAVWMLVYVFCYGFSYLLPMGLYCLGALPVLDELWEFWLKDWWWRQG
jgi:hypothetical protein